MHGTPSTKEKIAAFVMGISVGLVVLAVILFQLPAVRERIDWRVDFAMAYVRGLIDPVRPMPTPVVAAQNLQGTAGPDPFLKTATVTPTVTQTSETVVTVTSTMTPTATPTPIPTPLPSRVVLQEPKFEKQEVNNCGPATLAMHLRYYGWGGDQKTISDLIKPIRADRNVNVEELVYYVNTQAAHLEIQYRVGGSIDMLRSLIAAGFPVTIEEGYMMAESYWLNDDRWAGHYLLLTGYDDESQEFIAQDVFVGSNVRVPYKTLDKNWKPFNRVYIVLYPPEQRPLAQQVLGEEWDAAANRQHAIDLSQKETELDSTDSYAWFNLGTNLVYFEKYSQAAQAYDEARKNGLPQRMLRYQFGPFFAYFHLTRTEDLLALTDYALERTPNSEEAMLWRGWALYRQSKKEEAVEWFNKALEARPGYSDASYALDFVRNN